MIDAKMKTILNFLPVRMGGGLQNALSFLGVLGRDTNPKAFVAIVRCNTKIHNTCKEYNIEHIVINDSFMGRIKFELSCKSYFSKGQVCFTFFGPPMLGSRDYLINVVGCAYSNLFYPEIPFWSYLPWFQRTQKKMIDLYRKYITARGDYWIFETNVLKKRAIELFGFPSNRVGVVRMAPSELVSPKNVKAKLAEEFAHKLTPGFRFLFLSAAHPNKRQHLLTAIAHQMVEKGFRRFSFVTTMNEKDAYAKKVMDSFKRDGLSGHLVNIGPVPSDSVATLISCCDAMCSFSVLESFSNNFVEAWRMELPLLVSDADWARDACGKGAIYVKPTDAAECAAQLIKIAANATFRTEQIELGKDQLSTYPTAEQKINRYYREIEIAGQLGFCPAEERGQIRWPKNVV